MNQLPANTSGDGGGQGSGISPRVVVGAVVAVLVVIFILQNTEKVPIDFLIFSFSAPLWLILVIVALLGALLDDVVVGAVRKSRGRSDR